MKLNIDANASRPGGASTKSTRRSRSKLGQAMSEAWGALGKRKSDPGQPSPEALEQLARAQEQLARAKGILQLDRTLTAAERVVHEPSEASLQIAAWLAAELEEHSDGAVPLDPADFADASGVMRAAHPTEPVLLVPGPRESALPEVAEDAAGASSEDTLRRFGRMQAADADSAPPSERAVLEILTSGELPAVDASAAAAAAPLESTEIATSPERVAQALHGPGQPGEEGEPIRTRTMARLLVSHGYLSRALTIYDHLVAEQPGDESLRTEADGVRATLAQKTA